MSGNTFLHDNNGGRQNNLVAIGVIKGAHGIRGQVKIQSFTDDPEALFDYGDVFNAHGTKLNITLNGATSSGLIATIKGINDRNGAEALKGTQLFIDASKLPDADEESGEFYYHDLIGMKVINTAGEPLGKVLAVHNFGAGDILELQLKTGKKEMFAFTERNFPEIRMSAKEIVADLPEYLEAKGE